MITINHLKKAFGNTVACDIEQFKINDGEILGLVGNNGAGKTTLFRMLLDLLKPDEGEVALFGINPAQSVSLSISSHPRSTSHLSVRLLIKRRKRLTSD